MSGIWQYNKWEIGFKDQEFTRFFFLKTFFDFQKMDKKNVQNRYTKTLLTDENFLLDIENLW